MNQSKPEVISFKVDPQLSQALKEVPNKSQFIRDAVLAALQEVCPLCQGRGFLTPHQREHWRDFARNHELSRCADCRELHLVCNHGGAGREQHDH